MPSGRASRMLFVVRPDESGFRLVSGTAREALAHLHGMREVDLADGWITDADGKDLDLAWIEDVAATEPASLVPL